MRPLSRHVVAVVAASVALLVSACQKSEKAVAPIPHASPDILRTLRENPSGPNKAWRVHVYQIGQLWADSSGGGPASPRAKITLWLDADGGANTPPLAELYFDDPGAPRSVVTAADPSANTPYQLHFSTVALGPVMSILRNANEPVYLYFYEGRWSLGIENAEPVGVD